MTDEEYAALKRAAGLPERPVKPVARWVRMDPTPMMTMELSLTSSSPHGLGREFVRANPLEDGSGWEMEVLHHPTVEDRANYHRDVIAFEEAYRARIEELEGRHKAAMEGSTDADT